MCVVLFPFIRPCHKRQDPRLAKAVWKWHPNFLTNKAGAQADAADTFDFQLLLLSFFRSATARPMLRTATRLRPRVALNPLL